MKKVVLVCAAVCLLSVALAGNVKILKGDEWASAGECDPINPERCFLPFPNDFWLSKNATTGENQVRLSKQFFPKSIRGLRIDPIKAGFESLDGWAPLMPITAYFKNVDLDKSGVARYWNIEPSTTINSPVVLLDAQTGELVAHWVELDMRGENRIDNRFEHLFMVWPTKRLEDSRRYIVAVRGLKDKNGRDILPSQAFAALRDRTPTSDPDVEGRRDAFKDIFARLSNAGVMVDQLQLAWDFTTASIHNVAGRLLHMRDDAMKRIGPSGASYDVYSVQDDVNEHIYRQIEVTMQVPQYVDKQKPGARLVIGPDGLPVFQGFAPANFSVFIPRSLVQNQTAGIVLQYGHGLFGSRKEAQQTYIQQQANEFGYVICASDWIGLSKYDLKEVALMLAFHPSDFGTIPDRTSQGMLRALLVMNLMKGALGRDIAMIPKGVQVVSPQSPRHYYGNSLGGIMGTVYTALSTEIDRSTIGVGGGPMSLLLPRSADFTALYDVLSTEFVEPIDRIHFLSVMQLIWSRCDPGGYMSHVTKDPLPNTPTKQVLLQHGLGDAQVSYLGVYHNARSMGAVRFESNVHEKNETLFGFPVIADDAIAKTALIQTWEFSQAGVGPVPQKNVPPLKKTDTHEGPRRQRDAIVQMNHFFTTGEIINTCGHGCHATKIEP